MFHIQSVNDTLYKDPRICCYVKSWCFDIPSNLVLWVVNGIFVCYCMYYGSFMENETKRDVIYYVNILRKCFLLRKGFLLRKSSPFRRRPTISKIKSITRSTAKKIKNNKIFTQLLKKYLLSQPYYTIQELSGEYSFKTELHKPLIRKKSLDTFTYNHKHQTPKIDDSPISPTESEEDRSNK